MKWNELYPKTIQPSPVQISSYIHNSLWEDLCTHLETDYGVSPRIEHSICSGAPGWNVKYKKGSRALCTLYPAEGYFTAMVSIGSKEAMEAELLLLACDEYTQTLYQNTQPFNGGRWLMIEVHTPSVLEDVKCLISLRIQKNSKAANKSS